VGEHKVARAGFCKPDADAAVLVRHRANRLSQHSFRRRTRSGSAGARRVLACGGSTTV